MNAAKSPPPNDVRVLIVDDEVRLRDVLTRAIASWGFQVAGARSAEEALRLMNASKFDVSIVDLNLPGINGIELFEKLRAIHPGHQVIVLTGFGNLESARAAIRLDVVDFLEKPCPLGELEKSLHRATQRLARPMPQPLEEEAAADPESGEPVQTLEDVEREHIISALRRNHGNRTATALELGISRRTLQYKLSEYQQQGFAVDE
ncbi:MAG TPA: response regulator [Tepidisphaeraceae bacterium]|jgi:DNA-binding NtrC family response regulator|nr:response regulator [Tepidisphaeraceae bacterium]